MTKRKTKSQTKSIVPDNYRRQHKADSFAKALSAAVRGDNGRVDLTKLAAVAAANGVTLPEGGNVGTKLMSLSVALRAKKRHGEKFVLDGGRS